MSKEAKEYVQYLALMTPALLFFIIFLIFPILSGAGIALTNAKVGGGGQFIGLANFADLLFGQSFLHEKFIRAFFWTAVFWLGNWATIFLLGFTLALILYEKVKFKSFFLIIIFIPYVISNLVVGFLMRMLLDPTIGAVNWMLMSTGLIREPITFLKEGWPASLTLILVTGWKFAGFNMAIFLGGLVSIPKETIEVAMIDGCTYIQRLFKVIIPQMWPTIIAASVICFAGSWQVFAIPVGLAGTTHGGVKSLDLLAVVFYRWAFSKVGFGYASAMMFLVTLVLFGGSILHLLLVKAKTVEY